MTPLKIRQRIKKITRVLPKSITFILLRILLVFPIAIFLLNQRLYLAAGFFAGTSLIGYTQLFFKNRKGIGTQLLSIMDPFADKLLILVSAYFLWHIDKMATYVFVIFALKDIIMIIGGLSILSKNKKTFFKRNLLDKWTQFFQSLAFILIMIGIRDFFIVNFAVILTLVSGIFSIFKSGVVFTKKRTDLERIKFTSLIKLPDYITFVNVIGGLFCIVFSIQGEYKLAMVMLLISVVADFFDGKIARKMNREGDFGKELDSLADTVSFGVAPAVFAFSIIETHMLASISFTVFMLCGILRLAKYNVTEHNNDFEGLPITMNGVIIPLVFFFNVPLLYYPYIYLILGILMVSPIGVKKL